ncbi:ligand-binding sensor domain-containing protein [Ekhidna sp.]|uniref:ligand-binding sensor domain-containing protein n=1 Tax=Ekhidna sp. TaxID=2608089 RepID=UPI003B5A2400
MWFGTASGLCRYDGYEIKPFTQDLGYEISDDFITALCQDTEGNIWVGTNSGGINKFDPATETFSSYQHDPKNPSSIAADRVREIICDGNGNLWVGFDNGFGLSKFNIKEGTSVNYDPFEDVTTPGVKAIRGLVLDAYDSSLLWLGTTSGLIRFDIKKESFKVIDHPLTPKNRHGLFSLIQIDSTRLLGGFFHAGVDIYHIDKEKWEGVYTDPSETVRIYDLAKKSETEFWVSGRRRGLGLYDVNSKELTFLPADVNNQSSPFPGFTYAVYAEGDGVWVGGRHGISYSNKKQSLFSAFTVPFSENPLKVVSDLSGVYDKIYITGISLYGVYEIDKITGESKFYKYGGETQFSVILEYKDIIYLIGYDNQLYTFNKSSKSFNKLEFAQFEGREISLNTLLKWDDQQLLILTRFGGSFKLDLSSHQLSKLTNDQNVEEWQNQAILQEDGSIWFGTSKGVTIYQPESDQLSKLPLKLSEGKKDPDVLSLAKDRKGTIWLGTTSGLIRKGENSTEIYTVINSDLPGNIISQIEVDHKNNLWLKTQRGISFLDPTSMQIINYDLSDGIINREGVLRIIDEDVYYGTHGNYLKMTAQNESYKKTAPKVNLLSFEVANDTYPLEKAIDFTDEIILDYQHNSLAFSFTSPDFHEQEKISYSYRLVGQDKDWIPSKDRRYVRYTNLEGGKYTFQVKARYHDTDWGEIKSVEILLETPFWETWWFYTLGCLFIIGSAFALYKIRIRVLQRKADMETQELRLEAMHKRLIELNATPPDISLNMTALNKKLNTPLSEREFEVLKLSLEGKSNSEIGNELFISISTVKFHLRNTYGKLGVSNRKEALVYVVKKS